MFALGCNNSGREQLVAALPAQLDAQGWDVQQAGQGEGAAGQGQQAPRAKLHDPASDVILQRWRESRKRAAAQTSDTSQVGSREQPITIITFM
ncbi:hypothetical protein HaLaN_27092 [Haematococcus lacustris]|uniref:Uncharacterized protein n=1 Tax=Haematococcus lacustris TaxID=44745 RepID=A0A6A0A7I7_HAELA|nr:hypothetical protein HaLaN_27092 [Haematococcus lacustris]